MKRNGDKLCPLKVRVRHVTLLRAFGLCMKARSHLSWERDSSYLLYPVVKDVSFQLAHWYDFKQVCNHQAAKLFRSVGVIFFQSLSFLLLFFLAQLTIHWSKTLILISIPPAVQFNRWIRESVSSMILKVLQQGMCFRRLSLLASFTHGFSPGIPSYPLSGFFFWQFLHGWAANRSSGALQNLAPLPPLILALCNAVSKRLHHGKGVQRGAERAGGIHRGKGVETP